MVTILHINKLKNAIENVPPNWVGISKRAQAKHLVTLKAGCLILFWYPTHDFTSYLGRDGLVRCNAVPRAMLEHGSLCTIAKGLFPYIHCILYRAIFFTGTPPKSTEKLI